MTTCNLPPPLNAALVAFQHQAADVLGNRARLIGAVMLLHPERNGLGFAF